ncbi:MAG: BPL-N domain-containing protein [Candidatus Bathyarchaeaceae archaeon]
MEKFGRKLWIPICLMILTLTMISPLLFHEVKAQGAQVAIYNDSGAWADSVIPFKNFTKYKGLTWKYVTASDINNGLITYPTYKVLYMPGGYAADYNTAISNNGDQNIRNFVSSGGGYIGICAGAYFACDKITWEGRSYDYTLDLFNGMGIGSIPEIMAWDYAIMTNLTMNLNHPINQYEPSRERMAYYGGPYFVPNAGVTVDTVATYDKKNNERAAITFSYGSGRVFLIGTHPEIEEDKTRDGSSWGEIWYDYGSDWPLLWTAMDWLMKQTISQPPAEPALPPAGTLLFFEGFESGSLATNGWTTSGTGKPWYVSTESPYQGTYHVMAKATGAGKWSYLTSRTISTAGYTQMVSLRYHRRIIGHDPPDGFTVEWFDGTKWNLIEEKHEWNSPNYADAWVFAGQGLVWELPSGALNNPNFKIRFGAVNGAVSEKVYLDNIEIRAA